MWPDFTTAQTAELALVVSVGVAAWQVFKHLLEGPRLRVRLHAGHIDDYWMRAAATWPGLIEKTRDLGGWPSEVGVVSVVNGGRTPVTISGVGSDLGATSWWRPWLRHSIVPMYLPFPPSVSTETVIRLEPFSEVVLILDPWCIAENRFAEKPRARGARVRATVRVAGRRRAKRSPRWRGWDIARGQVRFAPAPLELGLEVRRVIWRVGVWQKDELLKMSSIFAAIWAREHFEPLASGSAPSDDLVMQALQVFSANRPSTGDFGERQATLRLQAHYIAQDLARVYAAAPAFAGGIEVRVATNENGTAPEGEGEGDGT